MGKLLSVTDVAEQLGVTVRTVQRWVRDGHFPGAFKVGPGKTSPYVIPVEDFEAYIEARRQEQARRQTG